MLFEGLNRFYHVEDGFDKNGESWNDATPQDAADPVSEFAIGIIIGVVILFCIFL